MITLRLIEIIDSSWAVLSFCIMFVFIRYILTERNGERARIRAAWAFLIYFSGSGIWHTASWFQRMDSNFSPLYISRAYIISGLFAVVGSALAIKFFTPSRCRPLSWLAVIIIALTIATVATLTM